MAKQNNRKGVYKTEAVMGNKEYRPSKSIAMGVKLTEEQEKAWDEMYREGLIERLKVFRPVDAKVYDDSTIFFNNNMDKPEWFWNEEQINVMYIWRLRDLVVLLENKHEKLISPKIT